MPEALFISQRIPYPPNKGDKIRSFNELRFLSRKFTVDVVTFVDDPSDLTHTGELAPYCRNLHTFRLSKPRSILRGGLSLLRGNSLSEGYFYDKTAEKVVDGLLDSHRYDLVFCFSSQIAQYVLGRKLFRVMDFCDVDSDKFLQYARRSWFPLSLLFRLEGKRLAAFEDRVNREFDLSIFITEREVEVFDTRGPHLNTHVFGNGVDTGFFAPRDVPREKALVFTGEMNYPANVDGVCWFCHDILGEVIRRVPDLKLYIVGRNPTGRIRSLARTFPRNVVVTGRVDDVRGYMAAARMAVVPLRIARGVQNKILEAMSMGLPVLMHNTLADSLRGVSREDILLFGDERECIDIITRTIDDVQRLEKMGRHLREYALRNHDWGVIFSHSSVWNEIVAAPGRRNRQERQ